MTFASRIAQASKPMPIYILEPAGDLDADLAEDYEVTTGWTADGSAGSIAVETTNAKGLAGGISFNKTAGTLTGAIYHSSLTAIDFTAFAYETLWLYLPSIDDVASVRIYRGDNGANSYSWTIDDSNLVAGWNKIYMSRSEIRTGDTYHGTAGSPTEDAVAYLYLLVTMDATGDTLDGIIVLPPRQHPYRYATSKITTPIADTLYWSDTPSITPGAHDPIRGTLGTSGAVMRIVDNDSATLITDIQRFAWPGRAAKILMGFAGDDETSDNYESIFAGAVQATEFRGRAWSVSLRDNLASLRVPFAEDATSGSPFSISGNALDVFLKIATSTGNGTNGDYDTLTAAQGAGVSAELLDIDAIEATRDEWRTWGECSFTFHSSPGNLLEWFFTEICQGFAMVPYLTSEGKISVRAAEEGIYPSDSASVTFGAANILTQLPGFKPDLERIRNQVRVLYSWSEADGEYADDTGDDYNLQDSINRYGLRELAVKSKGITSASVAEKVAKSHFYRIGDGSPPVSFDALVTQQPRQVGELVEITSDLIPDMEGGSYSSSGVVAELEQAHFNPEASKVSIRAGITSFRRGRYRRIAPSGTANYDSQSTTEKARYMSISDGSDQLGTANDDAHLVGP